LVNDLAVLELEEVGRGRLELDAGVAHLHSAVVEGDNTLASVDDPLQLDQHPLERLYPAFSGTDEAIEAAIHLAGVVGQDCVLIDGVGSVKSDNNLHRVDALKGP
jgi:hypothetical protein